MARSGIRRLAAGALALVGLCAGGGGGGAAWAQCAGEERWLPGEGMAGLDGDGSVISSVVWDPDGAGPRDPVLVVSGGFWAAGDEVTPSIAAWDGERWSPMGSCFAYDLEVYNGDLYAADGGAVGGVRKFNTQTQAWEIVGGGLNHAVRALVVHDGALIAGGFFTATGPAGGSGGTPVNHVARWNGTNWGPVGAGLPSSVAALTVHNGQIVAGGLNVHRWTGSSWQQVGGTVSAVETLGVYNNELIAGGSFRVMWGGPADHIARWDGQAWQPMGGGMSDWVKCMTIHNGELIVGGYFNRAGGGAGGGGLPVESLARWNGTSWDSVGGGGLLHNLTATVYRGELYVGGHMSNFDATQLAAVIRYDGSSWRGFGSEMDGPAFAFAEFGGDLYMGGAFSMVRGVETGKGRGIVRRTGMGQGGAGSAWREVSAAGGVDGYILSMAAYGDGLIVSGSFSSAGGVPAAGIARFDGENWQAFPAPGGAGIGGELHVHSGELYITGSFEGTGVARFDGAQWQPMGSMGPNVGIGALASHNGELYAGGIGGLGASSNVFRWDGQAWQPMGPPGGMSVNAMASYNGDLIAGGAGNGLARWNGSAWVSLSNELSPLVYDLEVRDGELIVAGAFILGSNLAVRHVARWDGSTFLPLAGGNGQLGAGGVGIYGNVLEDSVAAIGLYQGQVILGGWFTVAGGQPNAFWAHWGCEEGACYANCDGSTAEPTLNVLDFNCFLNRFSAGDPYANCDGSTAEPTLNVLDFNCFLNRFTAGCP